MARSFIREKIWSCAFCTTVCLGRHTHCTQCGRGREKNTMFHSVGHGEVTAADLLAKANSGASNNCSSCGSDFPGNGKFCGSCGNPKDSSDYVRGSEPLPKAAPPPQRPVHVPPAPSRVSVRSLLTMALCVLGAGLFLWGFWHFVLDTKEVQAQVTGVAWERSIEVLGLGKEQSGWDLPSNVKLISKKMELRDRKEVSHYKVVGKEPGKVWGKIGEKEKKPKDLHNGFERIETEDEMGWVDGMVDKKEPVYKKPKKEPWYTFRPYVVVRTVPSSGNNLKTYWPSLNLRLDESEGSKHASYTAYFRGYDGASYSHSFFSENEWQKCTNGSRWKLFKNRLGSIVGVQRQ